MWKSLGMIGLRQLNELVTNADCLSDRRHQNLIYSTVWVLERWKGKLHSLQLFNPISSLSTLFVAGSSPPLSSADTWHIVTALGYILFCYKTLDNGFFINLHFLINTQTYSNGYQMIQPRKVATSIRWKKISKTI